MYLHPYYNTESGFFIYFESTKPSINVKRKLTAIIGIIFDTWVITHCIPLDVSCILIYTYKAALAFIYYNVRIYIFLISLSFL